MKEEFVTGELARKLLAKGCPISKVYKDDGTRPLFYNLPMEHPNWQDCDAWYVPTVAQVLRWLREEKNIHISIMLFMFKEGWCYEIVKFGQGSTLITTQRNSSDTYEDAAIAGIEYVIDNLM